MLARVERRDELVGQPGHGVPGFGNAAIGYRKGSKFEAAGRGGGGLVTELELCFLRRLQQRHDDVDAGIAPRLRLDVQPFPAPRPR